MIEVLRASLSWWEERLVRLAARRLALRALAHVGPRPLTAPERERLVNSATFVFREAVVVEAMKL